MVLLPVVLVVYCIFVVVFCLVFAGGWVWDLVFSILMWALIW